jgi:hypothetical protein
MKKAIQIIGMMCMTLVLVTSVSSCRKNPQTVSSFNVSLPAMEGDNPFDDSKAYIDMVNGVMRWYGNDNIMMYSIDADYTKSQAQMFLGAANIEGAAQASFTGYYMPMGSLGFFAFYPASKASSTIEAGNRVTFNVDAAQTYEKDLFAGGSYAGRIFMDPRGYVGAATCDVIEPYASFSLKHIFGFINVRVKDTNNGGKKLKSVTIKDNTKYLTGTMSINIPALVAEDLDAMKALGANYKANGNMETYMTNMQAALQRIGYSATAGGHEVTLDCSAAKGVLINNSYKYFLIPLRPGALLDNFTVTLTFDNADDVVIDVPANQKYISIPGYYTNVSIDLNGNQIL